MWLGRGYRIGEHKLQSISVTAESAVLEGDGLPLGPRLLVDSSLAHQTSKERPLCASLGEGSRCHTCGLSLGPKGSLLR